MSQFSVILCATAVLLGATSQANDLVVIKAGSLFDSHSGKVTRNALIFVEGERIVGVEKGSSIIPEGAEVIDLSSSFVLPGVMDMHTHVVGNLDNYIFAGYFQSPHRATIGGVVNAEKTLHGRIYDHSQCRCQSTTRT